MSRRATETRARGRCPAVAGCLIALAAVTCASAARTDAATASAPRDRGAARSAAGPRFTFTASRLGPATRRRVRGSSWHPGCPVALADLRLLRIGYWGFDGAPAGRADDRRGDRGDAGAPRVRRAVPRALPDPPDAAGRRLRRRATTPRSRPTTPRRSTAARDGLLAVLRARLRPRGRRQPDREPLRLSRTARRSTRRRARTSTARATGRGMAYHGGVLVRAFAGRGMAAGAATGVRRRRPTTSTSPPPAGDGGRRRRGHGGPPRVTARARRPRARARARWSRPAPT